MGEIIPLIITADDFGYCTSRNNAIISLHESHAISRASLLVNGKASENAAKRARQVELPVGLHMNLTEGSPVSEATRIPTLVNSAGMMHGKKQFRTLVMRGNISLQQVELEMHNQMARFLCLMRDLPLYVDAHQHINTIPAIVPIFVNVLSKYAIPETRVPIEPLLFQMPSMHSDEASIDSSARSFLQHVHQEAVNGVKVIQNAGISFNIFMGNTLINSTLTEVEIIRAIQSAKGTLHDNQLLFSQAPKHSTCTYSIATTSKCNASKYPVTSASCSTNTGAIEWMTHPGFECQGTVETAGCGDGPDEFSKSPQRRHEFNVLLKLSNGKLFDDHGVQLVRYNATYR